MTIRAAVTLGVLLITLSGCAQWTTFNKRIDLQDGSVAIDAKQRVIYSREKITTLTINGTPATEKTNVICAEPSPDALAVLGASGALSVSNPAGVSGSTSGGFAEAASSIGLRTQSIQLLRDLNYRICEAYSNDAIHSGEAAALLRRGQSTMMGLIAIEQLTGPVVASQAALAAAVSSGTGGAPASDVTAAQAAVETKREAYLKAEAEHDASATAHEKNTNKISELREAEANELEKDEGKQDAALLKSLRESIKAAKDSAGISGDTLKDKARRRQAAQTELMHAESRLSEIERGKIASASRTVAELTVSSEKAAATTAELVKGVSAIVSDINASYFRDGCFSIVSDLIRQPELINQLNFVSSARANTPGNDKSVQSLEILKTTLNVCSNFFGDDVRKLTTSAK